MKWDPNQENMEHFRQSTMLYTTYYWIQVRILLIRDVIHHPFYATFEDSSAQTIYTWTWRRFAFKLPVIGHLLQRFQVLHFANRYLPAASESRYDRCTKCDG